MDNATHEKIMRMVNKLDVEQAVDLHNALDGLVNQYGIQQVIYRLGAVVASNYQHLLEHEQDGMIRYLKLDAEEWGIICIALDELDEKLAHKLDADIPF